jgi:hypothetical protein
MYVCMFMEGVRKPIEKVNLGTRADQASIWAYFGHSRHRHAFNLRS